MAVIPSGTSEPWFWAAREAAANDALARMFEQEAARSEEAQRGRDFTLQRDQAGRDYSDKRWAEQREEAELNRRNQREIATGRQQAITDRMGARGTGTANLKDASGKFTVNVPQEVLAEWARAEQKFGLPAGYLATITGVESAGGRNMHRAGSQYHGLFQIGNEAAKEMGLSVADRYDPVKAGVALAEWTAKNKAFAAGKGVKFTGGPDDIAKLYILHNQGRAGGTPLLLPHNATRTAFSVGIPANLMTNGANSGTTVAQFVSGFGKKLTPWYASYARQYGGPGQNPAANQPLETATGPGSVAGAPGPYSARPPAPVAPGPGDPMLVPPGGYPPAAGINPSTPSTSDQPRNPTGAVQAQPGGGVVPPSTVSPAVVPQPPPVMQMPPHQTEINAGNRSWVGNAAEAIRNAVTGNAYQDPQYVPTILPPMAAGGGAPPAAPYDPFASSGPGDMIAGSPLPNIAAQPQLAPAVPAGPQPGMVRTQTIGGAPAAPPQPLRPPGGSVNPYAGRKRPVKDANGNWVRPE